MLIVERTQNGLVSQFAFERRNVSFSLKSQNLHQPAFRIESVKLKALMKLATHYVPPSDMSFYTA